MQFRDRSGAATVLLPGEGFDAVHAGGGVEVLLLAPVSTLVLVRC